MLGLVGGQTGKIEAVGGIERLGPALTDEPLSGFLQRESVLATARRASGEEYGREQEQADDNLQCGHVGASFRVARGLRAPLNQA